MYREQCIIYNTSFIKNLRIIRNRDIKKMVILDNSVISFSKNLENGIHVPTFFGDCDDTVLLSLLPLLKSLTNVDDVATELGKRAGILALYESYIKDDAMLAL